MKRSNFLIMGIALLYLVGVRWSLAVHGILHTDNGRDLAIAWRIVRAHDFPLRGPFLTGGVYLGPLYPYLSAIPFALFGTATSLIFFISLLSLVSLHFGYKLGNLLFNREAGLVFAALLGSDFMATITSVQGGHTALIISSCLMYLYAVSSAILRREVRCVRWALVAAAVALQMHMSAVSLLPFLAVAIFLPMDEKKTKSVLAGLSIALLLYLPYLVYQVSHGWEDIQALFAFLHTETSAAIRAVPVTSIPRLFLWYNGFSASMAVGFSQFVTPEWIRVPVVVCLRLIGFASLLGLGFVVLRLIRRGERAPHGLVLAWLLLGWSIIPLLRPSLAWYALFPVYPAHLLLASLAIARLSQAMKGFGAWRFAPYALVGAVYLLSPFLMAQTFYSFAERGRLQIAAWLMKDLHHSPAETPGRFVVPYLGARREERMIQRLTSLPGSDTSIFHRIHGVPLWSTIFSRASLFVLYPPRAPSGEASPYHVIGLLQNDLSGRPIGQVYSDGPLILVRSRPSLVYEAARYSVAGGSGWHEPDYNDSAWRPIALPGYTVPIAWEYPPRPSMTWERRPVYFRMKLAHQLQSPTLLGVSFPTFGSPDERGEVEQLFLNGMKVGDPSVRSPDLLLYDVTPYLREGDNRLALAVGGGPHFILDLFTLDLER